MSAERKGNWMQTFTGRAYWPIDPRPEEVCIEDIAHSLSMLCRYTGHCRRFYSVAEHSVNVSRLVPPECAFPGLMHDATEAYVNDIARPLKPSLKNYQEIEKLNWEAICKTFSLPVQLPYEIHVMDKRVCQDEKLELMAPSPFEWDKELGTPTGICIIAYPQGTAKEIFMKRFNELWPAWKETHGL